jgi:hypothetical protein
MHGEKLNYLEKRLSQCCFFPTINVMWTGLRTNPGLRGDMPVITFLSQGMGRYIKSHGIKSYGQCV